MSKAKVPASKVAPAEDEPAVIAEFVPPARGAQVALTGDAQAAARGELAGDIEGNTLAKKAMEAEGVVADGSTPDGTPATPDIQK